MSIPNLLSPVPTNEGFVVDVQPPTPPMSAEDHETMRCDEAWKKLKVCSKPQIETAKLIFRHTQMLNLLLWPFSPTS